MLQCIVCITDTGDKIKGFKDLVNLQDEYMYDKNGNMIKDENKGLVNIKYNHINLSVELELSNGTIIKYIWLAGGAKAMRFKYQDNQFVSSYEYAGAYTYENRSQIGHNLHFLSLGGKHIVDNNGVKEIEYTTSDHFGNTRQVFTLNGSTLNIKQD